MEIGMEKWSKSVKYDVRGFQETKDLIAMKKASLL